MKKDKVVKEPEAVEEVKEGIEKEAKIGLLSLVFNRKDLNELKDKVNEIAEFLNK